MKILPLIALLAFSSCAHLTPEERASANAFAACMEQRGLVATVAVGQEVWGDLNNGVTVDGIKNQLEALAGRASLDAVACAAQAWLHPAPLPAATKGGAEMLMATSSQNPVGVKAAEAFLADHKM